MKYLVLVLVSTFLLGSIARAEDHIWSKQGTVLSFFQGYEGIGHVKPSRVYSPDHQKYVLLDFKADKGDGATIPDVAIPVVSIIAGKLTIPVDLDEEWVQVEVLWSPDSKNLALTGAFNAYTNSTKILHLTADGSQATPLGELQKNMALLYPPCKALDALTDVCNADEDGVSFNYATVVWANPHTVVIMAEVPCSSSQGGIMCQVAGYELDTRTGRIANRMTARQLKQRWQSSLAFNLRIPTPPEWKKAAQANH